MPSSPRVRMPSIVSERIIQILINEEIQGRKYTGAWMRTQIEQEVKDGKLPKELKGQPLPSVRSFERQMSLMRPRDESEAWSLADADYNESREILDVLVAILDVASSDGKHFLTKLEAAWIIKIRRAAPSLDPYKVYLAARTYMSYQTQGKNTYALDVELAFETWINPS